VSLTLKSIIEFVNRKSQTRLISAELFF